jgi:hypothetical protein
MTFNYIENILKVIGFIIGLYLVNRLSKKYTDTENFQDFLSEDKNTLADLIRLETERCSTYKVCGFVNGKNIPCQFSSCEDTCICKANPYSKKQRLKEALKN